jgi:DNA segregation ATPase FtsK/SpoIIIE-like protein
MLLQIFQVVPENLQGTGDMLFLPLGIKRIQAFKN